MHRVATLPLLLLMTLAAVPALAQDGSEWDRARAQLAASQTGAMAGAVSRWKQLSTSNGTLSSTCETTTTDDRRLVPAGLLPVLL